MARSSVTAAAAPRRRGLATLHAAVVALALAAPAATLAVASGGPGARDSAPGPSPVADVARLRAATLELDVRSPTHAVITASYDLDATGDVELLITRFPGQRIEVIGADVEGTAVDLDLGRTGDPQRAGLQRATLPYPGGDGRLRLRYQVRLPREFAFRYPVILPDAEPPPGRRSVRLRVLLPPGTWPAGGGFPNLQPGDGEGDRRALETALVAVPSFVHVPHGNEAPGLIDRNVQLELVAIAAILLPLAWLGWRRWKRRRRAR